MQVEIAHRVASLTHQTDDDVCMLDKSKVQSVVEKTRRRHLVGKVRLVDHFLIRLHHN